MKKLIALVLLVGLVGCQKPSAPPNSVLTKTSQPAPSECTDSVPAKTPQPVPSGYTEIVFNGDFSDNLLFYQKLSETITFKDAAVIRDAFYYLKDESNRNSNFSVLIYVINDQIESVRFKNLESIKIGFLQGLLEGLQRNDNPTLAAKKIFSLIIQQVEADIRNRKSR